MTPITPAIYQALKGPILKSKDKFVAKNNDEAMICRINNSPGYVIESIETGRTKYFFCEDFRTAASAWVNIVESLKRDLKFHEK